MWHIHLELFIPSTLKNGYHIKTAQHIQARGLIYVAAYIIKLIFLRIFGNLRCYSYLSHYVFIYACPENWNLTVFEMEHRKYFNREWVIIKFPQKYIMGFEISVIEVHQAYLIICCFVFSFDLHYTLLFIPLVSLEVRHIVVRIC